MENIIREAKKQIKMSVNGKYNYGPIEYLKKNVTGSNPLEFEKYINQVTDFKTYTVYCRLAYDVYIDHLAIFYAVKRAFPTIPDNDIATEVNALR